MFLQLILQYHPIPRLIITELFYELTNIGDTIYRNHHTFSLVRISSILLTGFFPIFKKTLFFECKIDCVIIIEVFGVFNCPCRDWEACKVVPFLR
jgi:hypothetical protein